jgi:hypothetical protein
VPQESPWDELGVSAEERAMRRGATQVAA